MIIAAYIFFGLGVIFNIMGNIGVLVFPDVYTRLQASSTCSTTSVFSFFLGCMLYAGWGPITGRLLVITLFFSLPTPFPPTLLDGLPGRTVWYPGERVI